MGTTQRHLLGLIAVTLICGAAISIWSGGTQPLFSIALRIGLVLLAIWLAIPQLSNGHWRASLMVTAIILALIVLMAARPKTLPIVICLLVLAAIVQLVLRKAGIFLNSNTK